MEDKILLVEDELNLGLTLSERLKKDGFKCDWVQNLKDALSNVKNDNFNLVIIDVNLPDGSGFDFASEIKLMKPELPCVFLTAQASADDRIKGLELGAEDYITKPFNYKELSLRILNIIKRTRSILNTVEEHIKIGNAIINFKGFYAENYNQNNSKSTRIELSNKECALLHLLFLKAGSAVTRDEILDHVWSKDEFPSPRTVDNFILKLRKIIELDPENPKIIRSIRGVGYQLILNSKEI